MHFFLFIRVTSDERSHISLHCVVFFSMDVESTAHKDRDEADQAVASVQGITLSADDATPSSQNTTSDECDTDTTFQPPRRRRSCVPDDDTVDPPVTRSQCSSIETQLVDPWSPCAEDLMVALGEVNALETCAKIKKAVGHVAEKKEGSAHEEHCHVGEKARMITVAVPDDEGTGSQVVRSIAVRNPFDRKLLYLSFVRTYKLPNVLNTYLNEHEAPPPVLQPSVSQDPFANSFAHPRPMDTPGTSARRSPHISPSSGGLEGTCSQDRTSMDTPHLQPESPVMSQALCELLLTQEVPDDLQTY